MADNIRMEDQVDDSLTKQLSEIRGGTSLPPSAVPQAPQGLRYAGFWSRFFAMWLDSFILNIFFTFVISIFFVGTLKYSGYGYSWLYSFGSALNPTQHLNLYNNFRYGGVPGGLGLLTNAAMILYFALMQSWRGQTIGKMVLGIKVVNPDGSQINFGQAFIRELAKILSGLVIAIGYLWMLWDKERRTWHDIIAKTIVINIRK